MASKEAPVASVRPLVVKPASGDELVGIELSVREYISRPFEMKLKLVAEDLDLSSVIGKPLCCTYQPGMSTKREEKRCFHGIVTRVGQERYYSRVSIQLYSVELRPWLWQLRFRVNCRVYQNQTVKDIVSKIFDEHGFHGQYEFQSRESGKTREYCVQFNESDLDFCCRLLTEEGLHYHFVHSSSGHKMVIASDNQAFENSGAEASFVPDYKQMDDVISKWQPGLSIHGGGWMLADYDPLQAESVVSSESTTKDSYAASTPVAFYYPGMFVERSDADSSAKIHQESEDSSGAWVRGASSFPEFTAGSRFRLKQHLDSKQTGEYLLTVVTHQLFDAETGQEPEYSNQFQCMPVDTPFRVPVMRKPRIHSMQLAIVTGPDSDEIYTNADSQVRVQFFWDQEGEKNENSSCWIRVAQPMASTGFGCRFLPRIGDEVVVMFIDGDPDRPLVMAVVYNGKNKPPYSEQEVTGMLTRSTPQGESSDASELRINDHKDQELFVMQAQKDMQVMVKNDKTEQVQGNLTHEVEKECKITVKEAFTQSTENKLSVSASQDMSLSTDANLNQSAKQELSLSADSNASLSAQASLSVKGMEVSIEGIASIELKAGPSSISINPESISISAPSVTINGEMDTTLSGFMVSVEGEMTTDISGMVISVDAETMMDLGASTMIAIDGAFVEIA
ncbi:type VI secretion system Vgr family protein [Endozoicomonadaceae bacterium StTr2]